MISGRFFILKEVKHATWLQVGRLVWLGIASLMVVLLFLAIGPRYQNMMAPYAGETFDFFRASIPSFIEIGISQQSLALFTVFTEGAQLAFFIGLGWLMFRKLPNQIFPLFTSVVFMGYAAGSTYLLNPLADIHPAFGVIENLIQTVTIISLPFFFFLFPNGKFAPSWSVYFAIGWGILTVSWFIFPNMVGNMLYEDVAWRTPVLSLVIIAIMFQSGLAAQLYRYFKVSTHEEKLQTKWVVLGIFFFCTCSGIRFAISPSIEGVPQLWELSLSWITSYATLLMPIAITFALFRYRLWQIDRILSHTLVYTILILILLVIYLLVIIGFQYFLGTGNIAINFAVTILVALLFQPLYQRIDQAINQFFFGERNNPIKVLGQIGDRLEKALSPADVLPAIVDTIYSTLRVPYVAITVKQKNHYRVQEEKGKLEETTTDDLLRLRLNYQGEEVGQLWVSPRTSADPFNQQDEQLLNTIASQAGTAVHAVQLTDALQDSRQRIVTTREEERKRLQRDLHDGLGPALAAQIFRLGAARGLLETNPQAADNLLGDLEKGLEATMNDIRRLVYGLRPLALDQLGLIGAIQSFVDQNKSTIPIELELPDQLPHINAATEVAAYRIVQTAVDNVIKHAEATQGKVTLITGKNLLIKIDDDGIGVDNQQQLGVGLTSIRERAEELGGELRVIALRPTGTSIRVNLPLPQQLETREQKHV